MINDDIYIYIYIYNDLYDKNYADKIIVNYVS